MKKNVCMLAMVVMLVLLAACNSNSQSDKENAVSVIPEQANTIENGTREQNEVSSNETVYPFEIIDYSNTKMILQEEPTRVVSLVPSETEIVFAIKGNEKLVGVNAYSDYPQEATLIESIGDAAINIEAVVALEPELVLASDSLNGQYIDTLRKLGLTVYVGEPLTYDATMEHIAVLGQLLNRQAEAAAVVSEMNQVKTSIVDKVADVAKRNVYVEFSPGWTVGKDTYIDDLITMAGGINISGVQSGWYEVSGEAVIEANPEVIIYPNFGEPESSILKGINERAGWNVIDAIQQNRIVEVSNEPLVRVGPRLAHGLQEIAKAIHPELFN